MNRPDVFETFHEPRGIPYYYGPPGERGSSRYGSHPVRKSHAEVTASIAMAKAAAPPGSYVFIKDMAYYLCNQEGQVDSQLLAEVLAAVDIHTFLIRNPVKQVSSLFKMSTTQQDSVGWNTFIPAEVGYTELQLVHETLQRQGRSCVVIDADDILRAPRATLLQFCSRTGIPFSAHMLSWEPNEERIVRKFAEWGGWHDSAISSSGWAVKHTTTTTSTPVTSQTPMTSDDSQPGTDRTREDDEEEATVVIERCIADAMVHYAPLFNDRVRGDSDEG
jgi:hypothetical protein